MRTRPIDLGWESAVAKPACVHFDGVDYRIVERLGAGANWRSIPFWLKRLGIRTEDIKRIVALKFVECVFFDGVYYFRFYDEYAFKLSDLWHDLCRERLARLNNR